MNLRPYIGIPYQPCGQMPTAADCWTLIRAFAEHELNQRWPEFMYDAKHYMRAAARLIIHATTEPGGRWAKVEEPELGDVLIFRMQGVPMHCAVYIGDGDMLHTLEGVSSCVARFDDWRDNLTGIWRWTGDGRD